jgi:hypothetical protein
MQPFAVLALLEVMDKEPGILGFWLSAIVLGAIGFAAARRRWWWSLPILALLAVGFVATWSEWTDPFVGPAIAHEAGRFYPYHLVVSTVLATTFTVAGMILPRKPA